MGLPCLFTGQQAFKMGYYYWLRVKNSNYLHAVTWETQSFILKAKFHLLT